LLSFSSHTSLIFSSGVIFSPEPFKGLANPNQKKMKAEKMILNH
jgi:hypothetical protein